MLHLSISDICCIYRYYIDTWHVHFCWLLALQHVKLLPFMCMLHEIKICLFCSNLCEIRNSVDLWNDLGGQQLKGSANYWHLRYISLSAFNDPQTVTILCRYPHGVLMPGVGCWADFAHDHVVIGYFDAATSNDYWLLYISNIDGDLCAVCYPSKCWIFFISWWPPSPLCRNSLQMILYSSTEV